MFPDTDNETTPELGVNTVYESAERNPLISGHYSGVSFTAEGARIRQRKNCNATKELRRYSAEDVYYDRNPSRLSSLHGTRCLPCGRMRRKAPIFFSNRNLCKLPVYDVSRDCNSAYPSTPDPATPFSSHLQSPEEHSQSGTSEKQMDNECLKTENLREYLERRVQIESFEKITRSNSLEERTHDDCLKKQAKFEFMEKEIQPRLKKPSGSIETPSKCYEILPLADTFIDKSTIQLKPKHSKTSEVKEKEPVYRDIHANEMQLKGGACNEEEDEDHQLEIAMEKMNILSSRNAPIRTSRSSRVVGTTVSIASDDTPALDLSDVQSELAATIQHRAGKHNNHNSRTKVFRKEEDNIGDKCKGEDKSTFQINLTNGNINKGDNNFSGENLNNSTTKNIEFIDKVNATINAIINMDAFIPNTTIVFDTDTAAITNTDTVYTADNDITNEDTNNNTTTTTNADTEATPYHESNMNIKDLLLWRIKATQPLSGNMFLVKFKI